MARKDRYEKTTHVITAAQGMQNPYSAENYGRKPEKGRPIKPLVENMERYTEDRDGEFTIISSSGAYVNEIELHKFFHEREDVRMNSDTAARMDAQKTKEQKKRNNWARARDNAREKGRYFGREMPMHFFWRDIPDTHYPEVARRLNEKIMVTNLPEPAQNNDPLQGNDDLVSKLQKSVIIGHPKQRFKAVPKNVGKKMPRLMISTGCCTLPNYNKTNRLGNKADRNHQYGFCVVDVLGDKLYLPRLVPARKDGTFIDLGVKYMKGHDPTKAVVEALILGDTHMPIEDPVSMQASYDMITYLNPKAVLLHDILEMRAINVHHWDDAITQMHNAEAGYTKLEEEVEYGHKKLWELSEIVKEATNGEGKIYSVAANHDHMFERWLAKGLFIKDRDNARFGATVFSKLQPGDWPLEVAMKEIGPLPDNVKFLSLTDDYRPWGVQLSSHGHKGIDGARGTLKALKKGYGRVVAGHGHRLEVDGDSVAVGTNSRIPMDYQKGQPSTSMHGNGVLYEGGLIQALPIINGYWIRPDLIDQRKDAA